MYNCLWYIQSLKTEMQHQTSVIKSLYFICVSIPFCVFLFSGYILSILGTGWNSLALVWGIQSWDANYRKPCKSALGRNANLIHQPNWLITFQEGGTEWPDSHWHSSNQTDDVIPEREENCFLVGSALFSSSSHPVLQVRELSSHLLECKGKGGSITPVRSDKKL